MKYSFELTRPQLRVFSAICSNLCAGWIAILFLTKDLLILTFDVAGVIVTLYLAIKAERLLEKL
ncbi:MAG: hypothetical protein AAB583_06170 [Patescibacteria group bacterium]